MKKNILEKLALLLSIILFLIPKYIAPVCEIKEDGSYMSCYYSGNMVMKLSLAIFIVILIMLVFSRVKMIKILASIIVIVLSTLVYMIPHGMTGLHNAVDHPYGFCRMDTMLCRVHNTFEISTGIAVVIGILMVFSLISTFLTKED